MKKTSAERRNRGPATPVPNGHMRRSAEDMAGGDWRDGQKQESDRCESAHFRQDMEFTIKHGI